MAEPCPESMSIFQVVKATFKEWSDDGASRLAAAFAYYAIFSIGPLLLITITIVSLVYGPKAEQDQVRPALSQYVGGAGATFLQDLITKARFSPKLSFTGIASIVLLLYAATNLFAALQNALNTIFDVKPRPGRGLKGILKDRGMTFVMVVFIGAFMLASVVLNTILTSFTTWSAAEFFPNHPNVAAFLLQLVSFAVSAAVFTGIFALIFKYLPDIKIDWKDTLIGALATSVLFTVARVALSYYLSRGSIAGPFGAAGSLVIIMLFIYYSAQVMFLGAEFTQIWACRAGKPIQPADNAVWLGKKFAKRNGTGPAETPASEAGRRTHWWPADGNGRVGKQEKAGSREETFNLTEAYPAATYHPPMS